MFFKPSILSSLLNLNLQLIVFQVLCRKLVYLLDKKFDLLVWKYITIFTIQHYNFLLLNFNFGKGKFERINIQLQYLHPRIPFNMINETRNFNGLTFIPILSFCKLLAITNLRASTLFFFYYYFSLFPSKICIPPCEKSPLFNIHENNSIFTPQLSAYLTTWPPIV